jgi:hypothetical protein
MGALIVERVESKSLNFEFFWKDVKDAENAANTLKIYFLDFLLFCLAIFWMFLKTVDKIR